jgi:uncharacterized membrane protein
MSAILPEPESAAKRNVGKKLYRIFGVLALMTLPFSLIWLLIACFYGLWTLGLFLIAIVIGTGVLAWYFFACGQGFTDPLNW